MTVNFKDAADKISDVVHAAAVRSCRPQGHLAQKIVLVDGQPGCGKTMLSPIIAALDRVELLTFAYELEYFLTLHALGGVTADAAQTLIQMYTDLRLYNVMMSRETNFRPSDQSSVLQDIHPWRYFRRLFQTGDSLVPQRIENERPILHLTTHNLLAYSDPLFAALGERIVFVELVRHPLYMIKQQTLNMETLHGGVRDFIVYFQHGPHRLQYFVRGWEELYLKSNPVERAIHAIERMTSWTDDARRRVREKYQARIITIPFECFVLDPAPYLEKIEQALETRVTDTTRRMMKKQNVPRKLVAQGVNTSLYRRCGFQPPRAGSTENEEFELRRQFAAGRAGAEAMRVLDQLCDTYEQTYLGGRKRTGTTYIPGCLRP